VKRDPFHSGNNIFPLENEAPNSTTNGGHIPAEPKPRFNLRPQEGCPTASKENVTMAFLMILLEDVASISINKV
jgi:hypothetical protein